MYIIAAFLYAVSIFIDIFTYHLKNNIRDDINIRYIFSLINIFQYIARGFVLMFAPIMSFYTENIKDQNLIWISTLFCQIFVVIILLPTFNSVFSSKLSLFFLNTIHKVLGSKVDLNIKLYSPSSARKISFSTIRNNGIFFCLAILAGFVFSVSITFIYYFSFYFPNNILMMSSISQFLNMIGAISLLMVIDPKIMKAIDNADATLEIHLYTISRIIVHVILIFLLFLLK